MANEQFLSTLVIGDQTYTLDPDYLGGVPASDYATKELITAGLHYRGELTETYTPAASVGDVYVVSSTRTVNGISCESGDLWLCNTNTDAATASNLSIVNENWDVVQSNIDLAALDTKYANIQHTHTVASHNTDATSITPEGTVSRPTFTGTEAGHTHTATQGTHTHTFTGKEVTPTGTFTGNSLSSKGTYKPEGTISTITHTPAGEVTVTAGGTSLYTPEGELESVSAHTHTGRVSIDYTPAGNVTIAKGTGTANYTPSGTINSAETHTHTVEVDIVPEITITNAETSTHTHDVTMVVNYTPYGTIDDHTHTINPETANFLTHVSLTRQINNDSVNSVWSKPQYTQETKTLTIPLALFDVANTVAAALTGVTLNAASTTFKGTEDSVSVSATTEPGGMHTHDAEVDGKLTGTFTTNPAGGHNHTFTGTGVQLTGTFTGTKTTLIDEDLEISSAGAHTHAFTGTQVELSAEFNGTEFSVTPTFTGTSKDVNVTGTPSGNININPFTPEGTLDTVSAGAITVDETKITPAGTISQPTFTGTARSHSHPIAEQTTGVGNEG